MNDYWTDWDGGAVPDGDSPAHDAGLDAAPDAHIYDYPDDVPMPDPAGPHLEFTPGMPFDQLNDQLFQLEDQLNHTQFVDLDGDGARESVIETFDLDHNGAADAMQVQNDNGNAVVEHVDTDGDGTPDAMFVHQDTNGDGVADFVVRIDDAHPVPGPDVSLAPGAEPHAGPHSAPDEFHFPDHGYHTPSPYPGTDDIFAQHDNFDPQHAGSLVDGDPADDMEHWHQQTHDDTCAIASQEFVLDSLTGMNFSEDALRQEAIEHGWYTPGGGTPLEHVGDLLEAHGIPTEREYECTLEQLADKLDHGQKVIVGVDSAEIWSPWNAHPDTPLIDSFGIPGQHADHAVEVIGIDRTDPAHPMVVLNDPGHPDGKGMMVTANDFMNAWSGSDYYAVSTHVQTAA
jgi:hypothetical protein